MVTKQRFLQRCTDDGVYFRDALCYCAYTLTIVKFKRACAVKSFVWRKISTGFMQYVTWYICNNTYLFHCTQIFTFKFACMTKYIRKDINSCYISLGCVRYHILSIQISTTQKKMCLPLISGILFSIFIFYEWSGYSIICVIFFRFVCLSNKNLMA